MLPAYAPACPPHIHPHLRRIATAMQTPHASRKPLGMNHLHDAAASTPQVTDNPTPNFTPKRTPNIRRKAWKDKGTNEKVLKEDSRRKQEPAAAQRSWSGFSTPDPTPARGGRADSASLRHAALGGRGAPWWCTKSSLAARGMKGSQLTWLIADPRVFGVRTYLSLRPYLSCAIAKGSLGELLVDRVEVLRDRVGAGWEFFLDGGGQVEVAVELTG